MVRRLSLWLLLALSFAGLALPARPAYAHDGVVHAVLFYAPTCPHCLAVMSRDLPPLEERYGDQLSILYVNVLETEGEMIWRSAMQAFNVEADRRGVPMLIVGSAVLVGEDEIPQEFPVLLEALIEQGGIEWPAIPGFSENIGSLARPEGGPVTVPSWSPALPADPLSAWLLLPSLIGMVLVIGYAGVTWPNRAAVPPAWRTWALLALMLLGLAVSAYLAYVELTASPAFCPAGDCDKVQSSDYAWLFGVIPIGGLGVAGFILLLIAWLAGWYPEARVSAMAAVVMLGMTLPGTLFAIYLTYLETFVIGALCIWCLIVALSMTALLLLSLAPAKRAMITLGWRREPQPHGKSRRRHRRTVARQRS